MKKFNFPFLRDFTSQRHVLGRLLLAYAELEMELCQVVAVVYDLNIALKALYRMRGESQRIQIADGLVRQKMEKVKLDTPFSEVIADMEYAVSIRNQYAHTVWDKTGKRLNFLDVEAAANVNGPASEAKTVKRPITLALLREQEAFFAYVQDCLLYLQTAYQKADGKFPQHHWPKAKKVPRPPKYIGDAIWERRRMRSKRKRARPTMTH